MQLVKYLTLSILVVLLALATLFGLACLVYLQMGS